MVGITLSRIYEEILDSCWPRGYTQPIPRGGLVCVRKGSSRRPLWRSRLWPLNPSQIGGKEQRVEVRKGVWTGQLVDSSCYKKFGGEALNPEHLQCTLDALKRSDPSPQISFLTDGDGLFRIVGEMVKGAKLQDYVGKKVEITGVSSLPIGGWATRELQIEKIKVTM